MQVDVSFNTQEHTAFLKFKVADFKSDLQFSECLAIITIFSGDFYLDPELELEDLKSFVESAQAAEKTELIFDLSEDGLELELA